MIELVQGLRLRLRGDGAKAGANAEAAIEANDDNGWGVWDTGDWVARIGVEPAKLVEGAPGEDLIE